jgi:hypothetical protein
MYTLLLVHCQNDFLQSGAFPQRGSDGNMFAIADLVTTQHKRLQRIVCLHATHDVSDIAFVSQWTFDDGSAPEPGARVLPLDPLCTLFASNGKHISCRSKVDPERFPLTLTETGLCPQSQGVMLAPPLAKLLQDVATTVTSLPSDLRGTVLVAGNYTPLMETWPRDFIFLSDLITSLPDLVFPPTLNLRSSLDALGSAVQSKAIPRGWERFEWLAQLQLMQDLIMSFQFEGMEWDNFEGEKEYVCKATQDQIRSQAIAGDDLSRLFHASAIRPKRTSFVSLRRDVPPVSNPFGHALVAGRGCLPFFGPNYIMATMHVVNRNVVHVAYSDVYFDQPPVPTTGLLCYQGYLPHAKNTRHAWVECTVNVIEIEKAIHSPPLLPIEREWMKSLFYDASVSLEVERFREDVLHWDSKFLQSRVSPDALVCLQALKLTDPKLLVSWMDNGSFDALKEVHKQPFETVLKNLTGAYMSNRPEYRMMFGDQNNFEYISQSSDQQVLAIKSFALYLERFVDEMRAFFRQERVESAIFAPWPKRLMPAAHLHAVVPTIVEVTEH